MADGMPVAPTGIAIPLGIAGGTLADRRNAWNELEESYPKNVEEQFKRKQQTSNVLSQNKVIPPDL